MIVLVIFLVSLSGKSKGAFLPVGGNLESVLSFFPEERRLGSSPGHTVQVPVGA